MALEPSWDSKEWTICGWFWLFFQNSAWYAHFIELFKTITAWNYLTIISELTGPRSISQDGIACTRMEKNTGLVKSIIGKNRKYGKITAIHAVLEKRAATQSGLDSNERGSIRAWTTNYQKLPHDAWCWVKY